MLSGERSRRSPLLGGFIGPCSNLPNEAIASFIFRKDNASAPLFALWGGLLLTAISLGIFASRAKKSRAQRPLGRVPSLWFNIPLNSATGKRWRWFTIVVGVVVPIVAAGWFWSRFQMRQSWPNVSGTEPKSVGLWSFVPPSNILGGFNHYRYGFNDPGRWDKPSSSASFVPLWEPLMLVLLSLITVLLSLYLVRKLTAPLR
jgi:hypothetical protein